MTDSEVVWIYQELKEWVTQNAELFEVKYLRAHRISGGVFAFTIPSSNYWVESLASFLLYMTLVSTANFIFSTRPTLYLRKVRLDD